jgi:hypothetical protein
LGHSGVAVDAGGGFWLGQDVKTSEPTLSSFAAAGAGSAWLQTSKLQPHEDLEEKEAVISDPESLAVEDSSPERFYVAGHTSHLGKHSQSGYHVEVFDAAGGFVEQWPEEFSEPSVAVDNTPEVGKVKDPSACGTAPELAVGECFVYVTSTGYAGGIEKFNSKGVAEAFGCEESKCAYVKGNKITGIPGHTSGVFGLSGLRSIAVDGSGDIYAMARESGEVYEYAASGVFMRALKLLGNTEVPLLEGQVGEIQGLAFDGTSGHLLVSVVAQFGGGGHVGGVDEFDAVSGKFVAQVTGVVGGGVLEEPGAMSVDSRGDAYVVDARAGVVDVYGAGHFLPELSLGVAAERTGTGAVLDGVVNPDFVVNGAAVTECYFEYVPEVVFDESVKKGEDGFVKGQRVECSPSAGGLVENETPQPVRAAVGGLSEGVTYRYRLVGATGGEHGGSGETQSLAFTTPAVPVVVSSGAVGVSSVFAGLEAEIKPEGAATSYHFEYDTRAYSGAQAHGVSVPVVDAGVGSGGPTGGGVESVVQHLSGLTPGTEYHFRVVASNSVGVTYGPDETFATLAEVSVGLPDGRAYELVTPVNKEGGSDMFAEKQLNGEFANKQSVGTPSASGDAFILETRSAFGPFPAALYNEYVFDRDLAAREWTYRSLAAPGLGAQSIGGSVSPITALGHAYLVFDPVDLSGVAFMDGVGSEVGEEGEYTTDLAGAPGGPYTTLRTDPVYHGHEGKIPVTTVVVGGSQDLGQIVLESNGNGLCGPAEAAGKVEEGDVLCEWAGGFETPEGGEAQPELRLVDLAPGSESKPASRCGSELGGGERYGNAYRAVSASGSRVFFTAPQERAREENLTGPGCWNPAKEKEKGEAVNPPQLYARVNEIVGGETVHETVKVSAPAAGVKEAGGVPREYPVQYVGASEDGSKVFFVTEEWLTLDHPETHDPELYECEILIEGEQPACRLTRVSTGMAGSEAGKAGAQVDWAPAVSADGSTVYFTAFNVLAEGATRQTPAGNEKEGAVNLYRYDTRTASTSYIATVETMDHSNQRECTGSTGTFAGACSWTDWYTTPSGGDLLFGSSLPIAGYNQPQEGCTEQLPFEQNIKDGRCSELYRYDATAAEHGEPAVICVSCGPGGADKEGNAEFARAATAEPAAPPVTGLSANGDFAFFDSAAKLVSQAENHTLDVYEWEAHGTGGCGLAAGCVRLISSPNDSFPSYFLGYSAYQYETTSHEEKTMEGGNVFFGTHANLLPQDTNSVGNLYDARICLPEAPCITPPPATPTQCEGSACQTPTTPPIDPTATLLAPPSPSGASVSPPRKTVAQERAEKLAKALKVCRKDRARKKRVACEAAARKRYGPKKVKKATMRGGR